MGLGSEIRVPEKNLFLDPGSRGQRGTGSRIRIRNTTTCLLCAGILEQSMGNRNREGIWLSYWPARLHRMAESIPELLKSLKIGPAQVRMHLRFIHITGSSLSATAD
jgi:hypothetical protein